MTTVQLEQQNTHCMVSNSPVMIIACTFNLSPHCGIPVVFYWIVSSTIGKYFKNSLISKWTLDFICVKKLLILDLFTTSVLKANLFVRSRGKGVVYCWCHFKVWVRVRSPIICQSLTSLEMLSKMETSAICSHSHNSLA